MKTLKYAGLLTALAVTAHAQRPCSGPGASFGITSYRCVSCAMLQRSGEPTAFIFDAEPVVLQTEGSPFQPGDVIVSVGGHPITTQAGADAFTYPRAGMTEVLVRRGGEQHKIAVRQTEDCPGGPVTRIEMKLRPRPDEPLIRPRPDEPLIIADGKPVALRSDMTLTFRSPSQTPPDSNATVGRTRFGFTLECVPSCTRTRASDGTEYWKYDGLPRIVSVEKGSPAERAGLRAGDLVLDVNGRYVIEEGGSLALLNSGTAKAIMLKVRRQHDGQILTAILRFEP